MDLIAKKLDLKPGMTLGPILIYLPMIRLLANNLVQVCI